MGHEITWLSTQKDLKQENENSLGKNIFKAQIFLNALHLFFQLIVDY